MKVYLDTSVLNVYLFGAYSRKDPQRLTAVKKLFQLINKNLIHAVISLYAIQEIYSFCKIHFLADEVGGVAKKTIASLFQADFDLSGLLSREERLIYRQKIHIDDPSDQPHVISALVSKCEAIITYDAHFQRVSDQIPIFTPEQIISARKA